MELPIGFVDCRVHDLRHTHASVGAAAGLSLPLIGALLGHRSPQTTMRYAHLRDDPLQQAAATVGGGTQPPCADGREPRWCNIRRRSAFNER